MHIDTEILSRIQFAFTISFHIIFPSFSIGLAAFLAIMEGVWLKTKNPLYYNICKFWSKIFALTFGMGVVSGIAMAFQLGTNWAGFSHDVGSVLGALFTYEVLTAFFIEAGFLGVMIFGWKKVGPGLHYAATLLVAAGVTLSAFWILSANSWMQTPAGAVFKGGRFIVDSWMEVIFNPSVIPRFLHMLLAAYTTTAFVIAGISAFYLIKKLHIDFAKKCFRFSIAAIIVLVPAQLYMGDTVGIEVHHNQPIKTAAMEAVWNTQKGAPFLIFAYPDKHLQKNLFAIGIPHMASLLNTHQWNGKLVGLRTVKPSDQPFVPIVFYSFRVMVGLGGLMLLLALIGFILAIRKRLTKTNWYLRTLMWCSPIGFFAIIAGWFTAETGRQPYVVYGLVRTSHAVSKVPPSYVATSLILIIVIYGIIFGYFYFKYLRMIIAHGPAEELKTEQLPFAYMDPQLKEEQ